MAAIFLVLTSLFFCATMARAEPPGPIAYVWQLTCAPDDPVVASYSLPEQCVAARLDIVVACEKPLITEWRWDKKARVEMPVDVPNPRFVRIATMCKEAFNGHACVCEYVAVQAEPVPAPLGDPVPGMVAGLARGRTILEVWRDAEAAVGRKLLPGELSRALAADKAARPPFVSVLDVIRAVHADQAAGRPSRSAAEIVRDLKAERAAAAPTGPIKVAP
jgi:hypothetical protein